MKLSLGLGLGSVATASPAPAPSLAALVDAISELVTWFRPEDIVQDSSPASTYDAVESWPDYKEGDPLVQNAWTASHPRYLANDSALGTNCIDLSVHPGATLQRLGTIEDAQHWFMVLGWGKAGDFIEGTYLYGGTSSNNPEWATSTSNNQNISPSSGGGGGWQSITGVANYDTEAFNNDCATIRKNSIALDNTSSSNSQRKFTPLMNVRDASGDTIILSASSQSISTNPQSEWYDPVLIEHEDESNLNWERFNRVGLGVPAKIAEIIGFSSALSTEDATTVRDYLSDRYSIDMN